MFTSSDKACDWIMKDVLYCLQGMGLLNGKHYSSIDISDQFQEARSLSHITTSQEWYCNVLGFFYI